MAVWKLMCLQPELYALRENCSETKKQTVYYAIYPPMRSIQKTSVKQPPKGMFWPLKPLIIPPESLGKHWQILLHSLLPKPLFYLGDWRGPERSSLDLPNVI